MKNKIAIILIILSFLLLNNKKNYDKQNIKFHNIIINKIYDNNNEINEYIGYISIKKYNINRLIKKGVTKDILDKNYVGLMNIKNDNLIVLAGHNINLVFHKLHFVKKDDIVDLKIDKEEKYKVILKKEISVLDTYYLYKKYDKKTLLLITCTKDKNKRLIVICKNV